MPAPSIEAFLELIHKSGVVDPTRLTAYLDKLRAADALPADAAKLASQMVRDAMLTHFQAQQLLAGKWRGFFIGKYKVLEKIGSGGMGTVYLAEHKFMKRRVAIKVLPKSRALEPSSLERFYREAKAIAALDHPNIVRAYDIDVDKLADGTELHFLVMEYVDGVSFQDLVRLRGPLDPHRAAHYIYQAAQGLHHAQLVGLVHRDIKPGNLLVDRSGIVKILDMGLARFFHDEEDLLTKKYDENVLGTADYLAPEQAIDSHTVDIRADIYSLGGTFYYLLTGRSPFGEGTVAQKLIWHQTRRPKPLLEIRPELPPDIVAVVEKMMEKSPSDRYQTPLEVAEALSAYAYCDSAIPAESDLPDLSPAARGLGEAGETGSGQSGSSPTALRRSPQGSTTRSHVPPVATDSGSVRKTGSTLPSSTPSPAPKPASSPKQPSPEPMVPPRSSPSKPNSRSSPRQPEAEPIPAAPPEKASPRLPAAKSSPRPAGPQATSQAEPRPRAVVADTPVPAQSGPTPQEEAADNVFTPTQEAEGEFSWSEVADTGEPTARSADTVRSRTRVPRPTKAGKASWSVGSLWSGASSQTRYLLLIGGVAGMLLLLAGVLLFSLYGSRKPTRPGAEKATVPTTPPEPVPTPQRNTLFVSKTKVSPDDFQSLQEALLRAAPGDRILVRDQEIYEESLVINLANGLGKRNILIEAEPNAAGETAILRPRGSEPILVLDRVEDFALKGFVMHGNTACDDLIRVTGACPGCRFEKLRLTGHRRSAVRLDGCEAVRGREVRFVDCHVMSAESPAEAAIAFGPAAPMPAPDAPPVMPNRYVQFIGCRFQGPFAVATVLLGSPNVGILFERNVFAGNKAPAFLLPTTAPNAPALRTVLLGNTFYDCAAALKLQQRMRLDSEFRLTNNLFYRLGGGEGGGVGVIENEPDPDGLSGYIVGEGNVYDSRTPTGNLAAVATVKLTRLSFDLPTGDPTAEDFLRYPSDSPLNTAGTNGQPVGALPPLP
ncbi:MAG: protein kinase [Gemmatales bacterium]|nr:protein kinase [Gemmatales bacterium]MDW8386200.1 protein kinase [Gemmatales bacterium]